MIALNEQLFQDVTAPKRVGDQRASALPFGNPVVFALFSVLILFRFLPCGFRSRDLRERAPTGQEVR